MALESLQGIQAGFLNTNWGGIISGMATAMKIFAAITIITIAVWFIMRNLKFKHQVIIIEKLGKGFKVIYDRGTFRSTKVGEYFSLLGEKKKLSSNLITMEYFFPVRKLFTKSAVIIYKFGPDSYTPINPFIKTEGIDLQPVEHKKNLFLQSVADHVAKEKQGSFWQQHGQSIILFSCLGMFVMMLIFGADTLQGMASTASSAVDRSADLMEQLARTVNDMNACKAP